jgi:hypothetical protein
MKFFMRPLCVIALAAFLARERAPRTISRGRSMRTTGRRGRISFPTRS